MDYRQMVVNEDGEPLGIEYVYEDDFLDYEDDFSDGVDYGEVNYPETDLDNEW